MNKMVLNWITNDVHFPLNFIPQPFHHLHAAAMPADQISYWKEHLLLHYLATSVVRIVPLPPWPEQFISAAHLEAKAKGSFCLVVDLRHVNRWFTKVPVKLETLHLLRFAPQGLNVGISLDLSNAYHHLSIADSIGHLFTFELDGVCFRHVGLPMGWLLSPMIFTRLIWPVISFLRCP